MAEHDAVLFDLDGVLVDSRVPFARCINSALIAHGESARPEEDLHRYLGPPLHQTFAGLVIDQSIVQPCVEAYRVRYRALAAVESTVFEGIPELLDRLADRIPLVVATSKPRALAEPLLATLGLSTFFAAVVGPDLNIEHEDKAATVGRAVKEISPVARPVMIGDRKYDIAAALANDISAIGVLWGIGSEDELRLAGAPILVRTPAELGRILLRA